MAGFWDPKTEPKRNYRYRIEIEGFKSSSNETNPSEKIWFAKKANKPSFTVGEVKANFVDKTFYYPGRVEWNTVEITMYDPVTPNVANHLAQMFANSGYFIPDTSQGFTNASYGSTSKSNATVGQSVGFVNIITTDEDGGELEKWTLNNSFIKSMKFGDVSYESDDMLEVTIEIRYDWATLTQTEYDSDGVETGKSFTVFGQSNGKPLNDPNFDGKIEFTT